MLTDNPKIDYLRISVTDRCNLRCIYCLPRDGIAYKPRQDLLTFEEILRLVNIFVGLGIRKIRLTGGEPLVRKGIISLVKSLIRIKGVEDVSLTTNGTLLSFYAEQLMQAGVNRVNISLDTLQEDKFKKVTGGNSFDNVLAGIDKAKEAGLQPLKLNMVVMKGINEDEIIDFINFSLAKGLILRFIEFMKVTPLWRGDYFISIEEVKKICEQRFSLTKIEDFGPGPAQYYQTKNDGGILGFIQTNEYNCSRCSRLRLTSTGEMKICLYEAQGLRLKGLLRAGVCNEEIRDITKARIDLKQGTNFRDYAAQKFYMCKIGG